MKEKKRDIIGGAAFLAFAVFIYVFSFKIQKTTSDILGSRFFPQAVAILIGILAVVQLLGGIKGYKEAAALETKEASGASGKQTFNMPLALTTVALFVYYFLVVQIGFTITSIMYLLFEGCVLENKEELKNKKTVAILLAVAVLVPVFLNFVFWNIFNIRLPQGKLFR